MTHVTLIRDRSGLVGFEAKGHTGYADEGSDIVCSAVSALTQTAALGINEVLKIQTALDITEANMYLMLPADISDQDCEKAQIILKTMALGLRSIAATYGDYIKISERKVYHVDEHPSAALCSSAGRRLLHERSRGGGEASWPQAC